VDQDGFMVNGKSTDYLGVEGKIRYKALLKAFPERRIMEVSDDYLIIEKANPKLSGGRLLDLKYSRWG